MNNRNGFSIMLIFWVIMIVLFAGFFAQSFEILQVGRRQTAVLRKNAKIIPVPAEVYVPQRGIPAVAGEQ